MGWSGILIRYIPGCVAAAFVVQHETVCKKNKKNLRTILLLIWPLHGNKVNTSFMYSFFLWLLILFPFYAYFSQNNKHSELCTKSTRSIWSVDTQ